MKFISHRGNVFKKEVLKENSPQYINDALCSYDVEIDVWWVAGEYYLGHDLPTHSIRNEFLEKPGLWCHAKDSETFIQMLKNDKIHCFYHMLELVTLTSKGYVISNSNYLPAPGSICMLPERGICIPDEYTVGICSDEIFNYFKEYK